MSSSTCIEDPLESVNCYAQQPELVATMKARLDAFYAEHEAAALSGLRVKQLPRTMASSEAWRDGRREARGLQVY